MKNFDELELSPFIKSDLDEAFTLYKQELFDVIDLSFGWDESFQHQRFENEYSLGWFHWIFERKLKVGYVCFDKREHEFHLSLII